MGQDTKGPQGQRSGFLGSLRDALAAASREDTANLHRNGAGESRAGATQPSPPLHLPPPTPSASSSLEDAGGNAASQMNPAAHASAVAPPHKANAQAGHSTPNSGVGASHGASLSAAEAARLARGETMATPPDKNLDGDRPPTTRVVKSLDDSNTAPAQTQFVRGKQPVARGNFNIDPVVGWLVIVGGPGIGSYRPIFEGNNTVGRSASQRIPLDFGDEAISSEEQAYIRYDSTDRSFLFVPNLAKTNIVTVNDKRPTGAVELSQMDVIVVGRTQLVFIPFCGSEFDWSELMEANKG